MSVRERECKEEGGRNRFDLRRSGGGGGRLLGNASSEVVLGLARNLLHVTHATGTGGVPSDRLGSPVVRASLSARVTARSTGWIQRLIGISGSSNWTLLTRAYSPCFCR